MVEQLDEESRKVGSSTKKTNKSNAMKRTSEWIFSQEIPSDVAVHIGDTSFALHKFPLVSKSGRLRRLLSQTNDPDLADLRIADVPGGAEAFELAAKFCYGINFEISTANISALRCTAEALEMTEEYCQGNLAARAEAYLNEVALKSLAGAIAVLTSSQRFLPMAEDVKLVSRCVDAIAFEACKETESRPNGQFAWWAEDLSALRIDIFQQVVVAMLARGFKQLAIGPVLMLYAKKALRGLESLEPREKHEKRVVLETIVSLLPREKNALSVSFMSMLLRFAIYVETTVACRLDLEKRMALQLGQAVVDDLMIPSYSFEGDTLFDVDTVQRIMSNYLEHWDDHDMQRVAKLMEGYLAEIASDRNLPVSKMVTIAELIPVQSRATEDGMYRAIDIYLKAHPALSDMERKKVCAMMDWQKLSREACAHAAQNDRLPVQTVVQVLYYEQQRLRDAMGESFGEGESEPVRNLTAMIAVQEELARLRRENDALKLDLLKLKMRVKEMEKDANGKVEVHSPTTGKPPSGARKSFMNAMGKKLGRLYPFVRQESLPSKAKPISKNRRHSIS